jgi:hypothetical protein
MGLGECLDILYRSLAFLCLPCWPSLSFVSAVVEFPTVMRLPMKNMPPSPRRPVVKVPSAEDWDFSLVHVVRAGRPRLVGVGPGYRFLALSRWSSGRRAAAKPVEALLSNQVQEMLCSSDDEICLRLV